MADYDTPNVVIPLALSYDTRNVKASTAVLAGYDQRKVNCHYDLIKNSVTGNATLELVKRPGISNGTVTCGQATQIPYLIVADPVGTVAFKPIVIATYSGNIVAVGTAGDTDTIEAVGLGRAPVFVDTTKISGTTTIVVQTMASGLAQKTFYATSYLTWTQITDSVFTGITAVGKMEHLGGFAFILDWATGSICNSNINTLSVWPATGRIAMQSQQTFSAGLARFNQEILAFTDETCEFYYNNGNPSGSPLNWNKDKAARIGLGIQAGGVTSGVIPTGMTHYHATVDDKLYFVGREAGGFASKAVYAYGGGLPFQKVSNPAVDRMLSEAQFYSVQRVGLFGKSALAIQMTAPNVTSAVRWLMYFPAHNEWFEWTSDVFTPVNNGEYFIGVGSAANGVYNFQSADKWQDDSTAFTASVTFKMPKKGNARNVMAWCGLEADTTTSTSNVTVAVNDDDSGTTFTTLGSIDLHTQEKRITRCGAYKQRLVKLSHSANVEWRARKFLARIA